MKTPAGKECPYFFGDYFRGRNREECRLLMDTAPNQTWTPDLCETCPVPAIAQANACEHQKLRAQIKRNLLLKRRVEVDAYCLKCECDVTDPHVGCGQCHNLPFFELGE